MANFICPHCGRADWEKARSYHEALLRLKKLRSATSVEVGKGTRNSANQVHNQLDYLAGLGFVKKNDSVRPIIWTFIHD
jgi:hypothetical protein